jgi:hypothetical protein
MLVAFVALFVALGGTSFAAVSYVKNAGAVDGKSAYASGTSLSRVAGNLVATEKSGAKKGKILGKYTTGVSQSRTFTVVTPVTDNATTAPVVIGGDELVGNLAASCIDSAPQPGREDPQVALTFTTGAQAINFVRQIGGQRGLVAASAPGQVQTVTVENSNDFSVQAHVPGFAIDYRGGVRMDNAGTADATCVVTGTLTRSQG